jgi:hypothetical protein
MVQPINYMLDVVNPMTAALAGYSAGATERTNQQVTQQNMQMAAAQEARAAEAFQLEKAAMEEQRRANQAAVAQATEAKRRGDAAMGNLIDLGTNATTKDYLIAIQENPAFKEDLGTVFNAFGEERKNGEIKFGTQLFSALTKNPDAAAGLIEERRLAAEAAGDQETVDEMKSFQMVLEQPEGVEMMRAMTGMSLAGIMGATEFKAVSDAIGVGGQKAPEGASPIGKIAQDVNAGLIPQSVLDVAIAVDKTAQAGEMTPAARAAEEKQIRGEWTKLSSGVSDARRNYSIIETSAADQSGAGDIALVTSFMKMLDPTSVVRETEFATARDSGGLLATLQGYVSRIEDGKFLTEEQRADFKRLSNQYLKAAEDQVAPVRSSYEKLIDNYGLNPENIFVIGNEPAAELVPGAEGSAPPPAAADAKAAFMENPSVKALAPEVREMAWEIYQKNMGQ